MGRLRNLGSQLTSLAPLVSHQTDVHGHSPATEPWRNWYKLARWQDLRVRVFERDLYTCQMTGCGKVTRRPIADHRTPHRGDARLFWDENNVQTLCKPCHDSIKQAEERRARQT